MVLIKDLDKDWFWHGYSMGGNSRKKFKDSPQKIVNLGKQGVTLVPEVPAEAVGFVIGLLYGRGKIVQNFNVPTFIQYQDKNAHKSKGEYLTASIGSKETTAGSTISLPFSILNNTVDNRGFIGYQFKIKYPKQYLTLNTITKSSSWPGSFQYQHDAENGVVLVQGLNESVSYADAVCGYLDFTISTEAKGTLTVVMSGPSGKGTGSDILTVINGENYFIQPLTLEDGKIKILGEDEEHDSSNPPVGQDSVVLPPMGTVDDPIGPSVDFIYDFELGLEFIGDSCDANLAVRVEFGDGSYEMVYIPVEEGVHRYQGKIPIKLPSLKPGPIIIKIWVETEDEDAVYYWFIKAGALWTFESEVPREEVNQIPIVIPKISVYEGFRLTGDYRITSGDTPPTPPPAPDRNAVGENLILVGGYRVDFAGGSGEEEETGTFDDLGIVDGFRITFEGGLNV